MAKPYVSLEQALQAKTGKSKEEIQALGLENLFFFARGILGYTRLSPPVHPEACAFLRDDSIKRKGMVWPRGCGKTTCAKAWMQQWMARYPDVRILYMCKTVGVAKGSILDMEHRILGEGGSMIPVLYPYLVPKNLRSTIWSMSEFTIPRKGSWDECTIEAAGIGTNKTKMHYDIIILDDPVAPDKHEYTAEDVHIDPLVMEQLIGLMELQIDGLFDPGGLKLFLYAGVRWGPNDAIYWLKNNWKGMQWFERPLTQEDGTSNFPTFYTTTDAEALKKAKGSFFFETQYNNKTISIENATFDTRRLRAYSLAPDRSEMFVSVTVDPALGRKTSQSRTAITACGSTRSGQLYVLGYTVDHLNALDTASMTLKTAKRFNPHVIGVEAVAYQAALVEVIQREMREQGIRFRIVPINRRRGTDKDSRILKIQPFVENNDFFIREDMRDLKNEMMAFPHGYKDLLDTIADHIELLGKEMGTVSWGALRANLQGSQDSEILLGEVPQDARRILAIYGEPTDFGTEGFAVYAAIDKEGVIYILQVHSLNEDGMDPYITALRFPDTPLITTKMIQEAFFKGTGTQSRGIKCDLTGEVGAAKFIRGEVIPTTGSNAHVLSGFSRDIGMKTIEFIARFGSRGSSLKARLIGETLEPKNSQYPGPSVLKSPNRTDEKPDPRDPDLVITPHVHRGGFVRKIFGRG